ncbi:UNVERIFIED_CONTAM: BRCA1 BRCA2-containing complex, subunit 3 [Siphonaria sp. JEL0065]|nr:BRCA1 BRCA2-containing complex, subunit 3 [Siphonaria sp. JEL0065]
MAQVIVTSDVYLALSTYALSTEKEEVLAMLLGSTSADSQIAIITHCLFCQRKDKRKDRVEISSEQLSQAINYAESTGTSVIGWAHSHPHITVLPSHVDLRCQRDQQMLSDTFIGLILSVFNDFMGIQKCQFIAFRSVSDGGELVRQEVPVYIQANSKGITPSSLDQLFRIPQIFLQEENEFFTKAISGGNAGRSKEEGEGLMVAMETSHYSGLYVRNMTSVLDKLVVPLVEAVESRLVRNANEIALLRERLKQ